MVINKGSDLIIDLTVDIADVSMIKVYTTDAKNCIEKTDISSSKLYISADELANLNSGVVAYDVYRNVAEMKFDDGSYNTVFTVYTDYYYLDTDENGTQHQKKDETVEEYIDKKIEDAKKEIEDKTKEITDAKQDTLVSGVNIKTINDESLLGEGNIVIEAPNMIVKDRQVVINKSTNTASGDKIAIIGINNTTNDNKECLILGNDNSTVAQRTVILGRNNTITSTKDTTSFHPYVFGASNTLKGVSNSYIFGYASNITDTEESIYIGNYSNYNVNSYSAFFGFNNTFNYNDRSVVNGLKNNISHTYQTTVVGAQNTNDNTEYCTSVGFSNTIKGTDEERILYSTIIGANNIVTNHYELASGAMNLSEEGKTHFSVGNGYKSGSTITRHNLLMANQDGDLYIVEKTNEDGDSTNYYERPMKRLQTWLNEKADVTDLEEAENVTANAIKTLASASGLIDDDEKVAYVAPITSGEFSNTTSIMDMLNHIDAVWENIAMKSEIEKLTSKIEELEEQLKTINCGTY